MILKTNFKEIYFRLILVTASVLIALFIFEIILRLFGFEPFEIQKDKHTTVIFKDDEILGWSPKPGEYVIKKNEEFANYKILEDGSRFTGKEKLLNKKKIIFVGGSFTFGDSINDEHTIPFKIQESYDQYDVYNFGVSGYGTYQSYLNLKKIYNQNTDIEYVIYLFISHHELRNTNLTKWLEFLTSLSNKPVFIPYVKLDKNNNIIEFSPIKYKNFNLSKYSVLITKIQKKLMQLKFYSKNNNNELIVKKIIIMMDELIKKNNGKFIFVTLLSEQNKIDIFKNFSEKNNIKYLNCAITLDEKLIVKNDGHPNNLANEKYAKCISNSIK